MFATMVLEYSLTGLQRKPMTVLQINLTSGSFTPAMEAATMWNTHVRPNVSNTVALTRLHIFNESFENTWTGSFAGTQTGATVPPNVTYLIHKTGGLRRFQGRIFQPGVRESSVDDMGLVAAGTKSDLTIGWNSFRTALEAGGMTLHQKVSVKNPAPAVVQNLTCDAIVSTQRRRLR
jgi:hypothetical protein